MLLTVGNRHSVQIPVKCDGFYAGAARSKSKANRSMTVCPSSSETLKANLYGQIQATLFDSVEESFPKQMAEINGSFTL